MNLQGNDIAFLVIVSLATYAYAAFIFSREPDPSTEFGISLNAMMAFLMAIGASVVACVIVLLTGIAGYIIVVIAYPIVFPRIIRKMISGKNQTTK